MSGFLVIECDERLNPDQLPVGTPFKGTHIFNADEILRVTVTQLALGTRVVVVMKACKGTTICHTPALAAVVQSKLLSLNKGSK